MSDPNTPSTPDAAALQTTPLHALHLRLGARMVPFAGYAMPVQYPAGLMAEHKQCRESAALFDVSHMGQLRLVGADAAAALESLVPVDVVDLGAGHQRYAFFTNASGGLLDDLMMVRPAAADAADFGDLFLVVNAGCKDADIRHLVTHIGHRCQVVPMPERALLALQGPQAVAALSRLNPGVAGLVFMTGGVVRSGRRTLLRHALGLHRRRRLRDQRAGRTRGDAGRGPAGAARGAARRPGRTRHAAPGSRHVPVRPRHQRTHQPGRSRPHLGHPEGAPPRRRTRRRLPGCRGHRSPPGQRPRHASVSAWSAWSAHRCAKARPSSTPTATSSAP